MCRSFQKQWKKENEERKRKKKQTSITVREKRCSIRSKGEFGKKDKNKGESRTEKNRKSGKKGKTRFRVKEVFYGSMRSQNAQEKSRIFLRREEKEEGARHF